MADDSSSPSSAEKAVVGKPRADQVDNRRLGREVGFGDEVRRALFADGELVGPLLQHVAGGAGRLARGPAETFVQHDGPVRD